MKINNLRHSIFIIIIFLLFSCPQEQKDKSAPELIFKSPVQGNVVQGLLKIELDILDESEVMAVWLYFAE